LTLAVVHAADIQDRDGGVVRMATMFGSFPFLLKLYADSGYQGPIPAEAAHVAPLDLSHIAFAAA
jgi:hypothetical protein